MSILPGTLVADALGNMGACSLVSSDGIEGSLHSNQLQAAVQNATGMTVQADQGPGLHSTFNSKGVGLEQPKVPVADQPEMRPELAASQRQNMSFTNG